ncbi:MAG: hypothetical protein RR412_00280 [Burkholderiaceae bacterium]
MNPVIQGGDEAGDRIAQECAAIAADLDRLRVLIAEAGGQLAQAFGVVASADRGSVAHDAALAQAVGALQFEDMALQLVTHAQRRLALLEAAGAATGESTPGHALAPRSQHHPVSQTGMTAGAVELF